MKKSFLLASFAISMFFGVHSEDKVNQKTDCHTTDIENVKLSPMEFMMELSLMMQNLSEKDQIEKLEELFKAGLTPDMVLMEIPAVGDSPAVKLTVTHMILGTTNKELLQILLNHGADIDKVNAEIDFRINELNKEITKMNEFKEMLQLHSAKN